MASSWTTLLTVQAGTSFVLDDGTGQVLVDASSSFDLLAPAGGDSPRIVDTENVRVVELLRAHGRDPSKYEKRADSLRLIERVVCPSDVIAVLGTIVDVDPAANERQPRGPNLAFRATPSVPLLISPQLGVGQSA